MVSVTFGWGSWKPILDLVSDGAFSVPCGQAVALAALALAAGRPAGGDVLLAALVTAAGGVEDSAADDQHHGDDRGDDDLHLGVELLAATGLGGDVLGLHRCGRVAVPLLRVHAGRRPLREAVAGLGRRLSRGRGLRVAVRRGLRSPVATGGRRRRRAVSMRRAGWAAWPGAASRAGRRAAGWVRRTLRAAGPAGGRIRPGAVRWAAGAAESWRTYLCGVGEGRAAVAVVGRHLPKAIMVVCSFSSSSLLALTRSLTMMERPPV